MGKRPFQQIARQATVAKMCFEWGSVQTHKSNVLKTEDLPNVQANKGAKDPAIKELLRKGNTGAHKTTHKNIASIRYSQTYYDNDALQRAIEAAKHADGTSITIEVAGSAECRSGSGSGHGGGGESSSSISPGQVVGAWEYDHDQRMQRYWDGHNWVYYDEIEKREKYWDGAAWQWKP
ncbi:hypothetical protein WAI453_012706 [Rhynchosporium graminicola]